MFNNCVPETNGETNFFEHIKKNVSIIFDVGCQASTFLDFKGEVHYFDPVPEFIETLINTPNKNTKSKFNKFGLGNATKILDFYTNYQSFYDRTLSCGKSDNAK